jgi:hypothetical protein
MDNQTIAVIVAVLAVVAVLTPALMGKFDRPTKTTR